MLVLFSDFIEILLRDFFIALYSKPKIASKPNPIEIAVISSIIVIIFFLANLCMHRGFSVLL